MRITVGMPYSELTFTPLDDRKGITRLKKALTVSMKRFITANKTETVKRCLLEGSLFRTGLLPRIRETGPIMGLPVEDVSEVAWTPNKHSMVLTNVDAGLRDYQSEAIDQVIPHRMGVFYMATGGGKTNMAAGLIARKNVPTLFLVHTKDLLWQTQKRFQDILGIKIGAIGDGIYEPDFITVATVQTLNNNIENLGDMNFEMIIQDETHHIPADTFYSVTSKVPAQCVYGLSATPRRTDGADMMIEAAAGPIRSKVRPSDLIRRGYLVRPVIRFIPVPGETSYSQAPRHMVVSKYIVNNEPRNKLIAYWATELASKNNSVLIAVNQVKHAKVIQETIMKHHGAHKSIILEGTHDSTTRKKVFDQLAAKKVKILISTLMKEGVDIPSLDALVNAGGGSDSMQLIGRVLRKAPGKETATVIDFMDYGHIRLLQNSRSRLEWCKSEEEFVIVRA